MKAIVAANPGFQVVVGARPPVPVVAWQIAYEPDARLAFTAFGHINLAPGRGEPPVGIVHPDGRVSVGADTYPSLEAAAVVLRTRKGLPGK